MIDTKINTDCEFYLGNKPCKFHKIDGRLCGECDDYRKIETRILVIKLDALGDVLRTTSILPALKKKYNNSSITWITRKNAFDLLANNEFINKKYAVEENYLEFILVQKYDVGICLDADCLSASILSIANCKEKLGFICDDNGSVIPANNETEMWYLMGLNDKLKSQNRDTYQSYIYNICKLTSDIYKPQINLDKSSVDKAKRFYVDNDIAKYDNIIGINTGGGSRWQYKKWILDYYPILIDLIKKNHPEVGILLFGGPEEIDFNKDILKKVNDNVVNTGCNNSLNEFAAFINLCEVFFTPDSLGMHISIALEKNTIVSVGPTSPWELEVYNKGEVIYNNKLDCISCYLNTCDKKVNCMNTLTPELIYKSLRKYL